MKKRTTNVNRDALAAVRRAAREATSGTGVPGMRTATRPVRFTDRRKKAARTAARGRSWKGD